MGSGDSTRKWSWGQFFGWGVGGAIGCGGSSAGINAALASPTGPGAGAAAVTSGVIGAVGGFVGGAAGYALSYWWDAPAIRWSTKSALLFATVFSMLIASLLGFSAINYMAANPKSQETCIFVISVISGFISGGLRGVLNNLRLTEND